jgi:drug/metabolite transporter (DMT)-like permease
MIEILAIGGFLIAGCAILVAGLILMSASIAIDEAVEIPFIRRKVFRFLFGAALIVVSAGWPFLGRGSESAFIQSLVLTAVFFLAGVRFIFWPRAQWAIWGAGVLIVGLLGAAVLHSLVRT